jgi:hypothetical protein
LNTAISKPENAIFNKPASASLLHETWQNSLWLAETSQQPISQTTWLKVTPHCNHCNHCTRHGKATSTEKPTNQITRIVTANNWA